MICDDREQRGSHATLIVFMVIMLFFAAIVYLLSHSRTGTSGVVRDSFDEMDRPIPKDRPQKGTANGPILVNIAEIRLQGNPRESNSLYCSVVVGVLNTADREIRTLVLAFDYVSPTGEKSSGSTAYAALESDTYELKQHHIAKLSDCRGLTAKLTVITCTIDPGIDCSLRIQAIHQGMVTMQ
jgi:hypothetical protein